MKTQSGPSPSRRYLFLLRHAKSAWPPDVEDHDRPLADRGLKAAPMIGAYMARERLFPDSALVSTARRTQETWKLVAKELPNPIPRRDVSELYEAPATRLADILAAVDPNDRTVMMVGHNPGLQDFADWLVGSGDAEMRHQISEKFPTGGLAVISFEADGWADVSSGSGRLERFVTPRVLAAALSNHE